MTDIADELQSSENKKNNDDEKGVFQIMDMLLGKKRAADRRRWIENKGNIMEIE